MLISEFAIAAGLSRDTIRFYVRLSLLQSQTTAKGGRRPYQLFSAEGVQAARIIRIPQSLGMSLKKISGTAKLAIAMKTALSKLAEELSGPAVDLIQLSVKKPVEVSVGAGLGKIVELDVGRLHLSDYATTERLEDWAGAVAGPGEIESGSVPSVPPCTIGKGAERSSDY